MVNMRLSKYFQLHDRFRAQLLGEAFNVQNRVNYNGMVSTWGTTIAPSEYVGKLHFRGQSAASAVGPAILVLAATSDTR